jgi:ribosomal protein S18 acetylase RimI-like enzyme
LDSGILTFYFDAALHDSEVAETDGRVVAVLHRDDPELANLEVAPDYKGRGLGSVLMAHAEAMGVQWLEVRAFDRPAIRLYERRG